MARPNRQGVDYFSLDVHLDDKFKFIEMKFGLKGFGLIIKLYQKIYSVGYWYKWDEDIKLIFSHDNNIDIEFVDSVVQEALERDIFDKTLFEKYQILTSRGIQKRYKDIVRRRKDVEITEEYLLITGEFGQSDNIISVNDNNIRVNDNIVTAQCKHSDVKSTQSKVKESKVKESKSLSSDDDDDNDNIYTFFEEQFGRTIRSAEFKQISYFEENYSKELIKEAVSRAVLNQAMNIPYIKTILNAWHDKGITSIQEVYQADAKFKKLKKGSKKKQVAHRSNNKSDDKIPSYYDIYKDREG